ncbi:MAG: hypothetical protein KDD82_14185, partial [Planctomycetes bacterium]|nr:hypothetical protein [Planctomycetota bacterium]
ISCQWVIDCAGPWLREVGLLAGIEIPAFPAGGAPGAAAAGGGITSEGSSAPDEERRSGEISSSSSSQAGVSERGERSSRRLRCMAAYSIGAGLPQR